MKKAEKKEVEVEVRAELYPLSKKEFEDLYNKAWENGWVYGKFFQELYDEYLVNWVYFVDYLDVLKGVNRDHRMYKRVQEKFVIVIAKNQQPILIEAEDFYFKSQILKKIAAYKCPGIYSYYRLRNNSLQNNRIKVLLSVWNINRNLNNMNFIDNFISIFLISYNSLKKYGFR